MPDTLGERGSHVSDMSSATTSMGADKRVEIQIVTRRQRLDPVFIKTIEIVAAIKAQKTENIGTKRSCQAAQALGLLEGGVHRTSGNRKIQNSAEL